MLKIGVRLQIIPPNAQQRFAPLLTGVSFKIAMSRTGIYLR